MLSWSWMAAVQRAVREKQQEAVVEQIQKRTAMQTAVVVVVEQSQRMIAMQTAYSNKKLVAVEVAEKEVHPSTHPGYSCCRAVVHMEQQRGVQHQVAALQRRHSRHTRTEVDPEEHRLEEAAALDRPKS